MTINSVYKVMAVSAFVSATAFANAGDAIIAKKIKWKMQSAWSTSVPNAGESGVEFVDSINTMSGGENLR